MWTRATLAGDICSLSHVNPRLFAVDDNQYEVVNIAVSSIYVDSTNTGW